MPIGPVEPRAGLGDIDPQIARRICHTIDQLHLAVERGVGELLDIGDIGQDKINRIACLIAQRIAELTGVNIQIISPEIARHINAVGQHIGIRNLVAAEKQIVARLVDRKAGLPAPHVEHAATDQPAAKIIVTINLIERAPGLVGVKIEIIAALECEVAPRAIENHAFLAGKTWGQCEIVIRRQREVIRRA